MGARQHENIQPAVVIVVEEGDARAHRLDDIVAVVGIPVDDRSVKTGLFGDVAEMCVEGTPGRLSASVGATPRDAIPSGLCARMAAWAARTASSDRDVMRRFHDNPARPPDGHPQAGGASQNTIISFGL